MDVEDLKQIFAASVSFQRSFYGEIIMSEALTIINVQ